MNWFEIKREIRKELLSRNLKTPNRRLNELDNLEDIFKTHFNKYIKDPEQMFGKTDKEKFKELVSKIKPNNKLNGAEISLINEIYHQIEK